jgi:hypothetical protein
VTSSLTSKFEAHLFFIDSTVVSTNQCVYLIFTYESEYKIIWRYRNTARGRVRAMYCTIPPLSPLSLFRSAIALLGAHPSTTILLLKYNRQAASIYFFQREFIQSIHQSSLLFHISFHISKMNHYKMNYKMGIDPKLQKAMTACFNPIPNCGTGMTMDYQGGGSNERRTQRRSRSKQREAMRRMEDDVKKHVAQAAAGRSESLLTREDDATLLTEVDLINPKSTETETDSSGSDFSSGSYSSSSETRDLNTIADSHNENRYSEAAAAAAAKGRPPKTMGTSAFGNNVNVINTDDSNTNNDNNGNVISPTSSAGALKHTTTMYTQSMRSKFDYVRKHQQFAKPGSDPPSDKSVASTKSLNGADAAKFMNWNLTTRRNELAKQILKRRQNMPTPTASRTGFDP